MNLADLIDHIDAEVFTGDMLYDADKRSALAFHIKRWGSAIETHLQFYPGGDTADNNTETPALYVKVEGGVVQAIAVRNIDLGDQQLEVIIDDLDSAEEDGRPDLIAFNDGEVPKEFVFIF